MCQSHPAAPTDIPPGLYLSSRCSVRTCTLQTQRVDSGEHRPSYIKVISKIPFTHAFETVQKESKTNKKKQKTKHRAPIQRVVIYSSRYKTNIQGAFSFFFFFFNGSAPPHGFTTIRNTSSGFLLSSLAGHPGWEGLETASPRGRHTWALSREKAAWDAAEQPSEPQLCDPE